jgi:hypothetical protein
VIDEEMRDSGEFGRGWFCCADVHFTEELPAIGRNNHRIVSGGKCDRYARFANSSRSSYYHEVFIYFRSHNQKGN